MINVVYVNNDGSGLAEQIELREGVGLSELLRIKGARAGLSCSVNNELVTDYLANDRILEDNDKIVIAPTKLKVA